MLTELLFFFFSPPTSHSRSQEQPQSCGSAPAFPRAPRSACPSPGLFSAQGLSQGNPARRGGPDLQLPVKEQSAHAMAFPTPSSLPSHVPVLPDSLAGNPACLKTSLQTFPRGYEPTAQT